MALSVPNASQSLKVKFFTAFLKNVSSLFSRIRQEVVVVGGVSGL